MNVGAYSAIILVPAWSCLVIITLTLMSPWARKTGEEDKRTIAQSKITEATVRLSVLNERIFNAIIYFYSLSSLKYLVGTYQ